MSAPLEPAMPLDQQLPEGAGARLRLAEERRRAGDDAGAEAAYRGTLALEPRHLAAMLGLAQVVGRRCGAEAALPLLRLATEAHPAHGGARLELAEALRRAGCAEAAEAEFRRVAGSAPAHAAGALLGLARIARERGDGEALDGFRAALAANPGSLGLRLELAQELARLGRTAEAEAAYAAVLELSPDHLGGLIALGQAARARGEREAALARFEAAATSHPSHPGAALELAHELRDAGRLDEAEARYRAVLAAMPAPRQSVAALLGLGLLERLRGDRAASLSCIEAALGLALPEGPAAALAPALELAAELRDRGAHDDAARILDAVSATGTPPLSALLARGLLHRARGDRAAALAAFEEAARHHPAHAQPLVEAALEHRALGAPEAAAAALRRALAFDPGHLGAELQYSDLLWMAEDAEGSLAICRRLVAARPGALQPRLDAARALAQLGRVAEALGMLEDASARFGSQPAIALRRAEILGQSGELRAARAILAAASGAAPHHHGLRVRAAQAALAAGEAGAARDLLADSGACPPQTVADHAALALLRGQLADARWQPAAALAAFDAALRLDPRHAGALAESARACLLLMDAEGAWRRLEASLRVSASSLKLRGRSARASQHHLGQILDEFRLDPETVARLAVLGTLPAVERIAPLLDLLRGAPGSTPAAIALMLALRQAGMLDRTPSGGTIPRRIGQYWDATEPPGDVRALMETWSAGHPGWAHHVFDDAGARAFLRDAAAAGWIGTEVPDAYLCATMPAQKADVFRLAWLAVEGGWWLDADDRCVGPLDGLAPPDADLVLYQEEYATLGNNMIGAAPGHPVIRHALHLAAKAVNRGDADVVWLSTGPGLLTRAFACLLATEGGTDAAWLPGVAVLERGVLARAVARHCRAAYKSTDRHWLRATGAARRVRLETVG
jgi:tetratricopeptide (TPR) repeat protein